MRNSEYGTGMDIALNQMSKTMQQYATVGVFALIGYYIHKLTKRKTAHYHTMRTKSGQLR